MTEDSYLIERITKADEKIRKNLLRYSRILAIGNIFSVIGLIILCLSNDIITNSAFVFVACSSIIAGVITVKLCDMFEDLKDLNSSVIVRLNDKEVN